MNLGIGAIFKDEFDYILEWLAWHQMAGFDNFFIADNDSKDGTKQILEALSEINKINLIYQPTLTTHSQIKAYQRISEVCLNKMDAILFIDADEFVVHESMIDGIEYQYLYSLLKNPDVGMVGINWRIFGSSGLENQDPRPVTERFNLVASDNLRIFNSNHHIKTISKIKYVKKIFAHHVDSFGLIYSNARGNEIDDFVFFKDGKLLPQIHFSAMTKSIITSPIRINHYVIKSKQEFLEKKEKRGDAMLGPSHERGMKYFDAHDFKDGEFYIPTEKIQRLKERIKGLWESVHESSYGRTLRGFIDINNEQMVRGWLCDQKGSSQNLKVNIFVNSVYQGSVECGFYRPDLKEKGISKDGFSGFGYTHPMPLKSGDKVEIFVHANNYKFPQNASVEIN